MPLFRRDRENDSAGEDAERRRRMALVIAMAAHVERNTPTVFPPATTDRLEDAADELLGDEPLSFETATVVRRALESVLARRPDRPWADALAEALEE